MPGSWGRGPLSCRPTLWPRERRASSHVFPNLHLWVQTWARSCFRATSDFFSPVPVFALRQAFPWTLRSSTLSLSLPWVFWSSSCSLALGRLSGWGSQFSGTPLRALWGSGCSVVHPREPCGAAECPLPFPFWRVGWGPYLDGDVHSPGVPDLGTLDGPRLWKSQLAGIREWQSLNQALFRLQGPHQPPSGCFWLLADLRARIFKLCWFPCSLCIQSARVPFLTLPLTSCVVLASCLTTLNFSCKMRLIIAPTPWSWGINKPVFVRCSD